MIEFICKTSKSKATNLQPFFTRKEWKKNKKKSPETIETQARNKAAEFNKR